MNSEYLLGHWHETCTWPNVLPVSSMRLDKCIENAWLLPNYNEAKTMGFPCVYPSHGKRRCTYENYNLQLENFLLPDA